MPTLLCLKTLPFVELCLEVCSPDPDEVSLLLEGEGEEEAEEVNIEVNEGCCCCHPAEDAVTQWSISWAKSASHSLFDNAPMGTLSKRKYKAMYQGSKHILHWRQSILSMSSRTLDGDLPSVKL